MSDLALLFSPEHLATWGLPGLALVAFLAGSVVPLPSDAVLAALVYGGTEPILTVAVATLANAAGAVTIFWIGARVAAGGGGFLGRWVKRRAEKNPQGMERANARIRRWGAPALLLSWLPIVGDAVVLAAGFAGMKRGPFLFWMTTGKTLRFVTVALGALAVT